MTSTIQLPPTFTASVITQVSDMMSNFSPYITLIAGVLLAAVVIEIIVGAIRHRG